MENWEKNYAERKFSIETAKPSQVVVEGFARLNLPRDFRALDLGCGNGRNSIYAAKLGGLVEAVDLVDLKISDGIPEELKNRVTFHKMSVMDFEIQPNTYSAIIAARLFQYLNESELNDLLRKIKKGLTAGGLAMFSYTASGGIFKEPGIDVHKFHHPIDVFKRVLKNSGLATILLEGGEGKSSHVPYAIPNETYDILANKKYNEPA